MHQSPVLGAGSGCLPELPTHRNPGLEIVVIEEGTLNWHIDGAPYRVSPGTAFFTFPWEEHGSMAEREPGHRWSFLLLNVGGERSVSRGRLDPGPIFGNAKDGERILEEIHAAKIRTVASGLRLPSLIRWALEDFRAKGPYSNTTLQCIARWSLIELARSLKNSKSNDTRSSIPWSVERFLNKLADQSDRPWTLEEMARSTGLGRTRFSDIVRRITGDTPMEHLQRIRVGRAQHLLCSTSLGVTEIAMTCGFSTSQHFARIFRHFAGKTASAYRQQFQAPTGEKMPVATPRKPKANTLKTVAL